MPWALMKMLTASGLLSIGAMMDSDKNKLLWESIRSEPDAMKAIRLATQVGEDAVMSSEKDRASMKKELADVKKILSGNGDPSHSLLNRVTVIEADTTHCKGKIDRIERLLVGDIDDGTDKESILAMVKKSDKIANNAIKIAWLVLGAFITQVVLQILQLF